MILKRRMRAEPVSIVVKLCACFGLVFDSNLGFLSTTSTEVSRGFSQYFK